MELFPEGYIMLLLILEKDFVGNTPVLEMSGRLGRFGGWAKITGQSS